MFTPRKLIVFGLISVVFLVFVSWIFTTVSGSFHDITRKAQTEHIATLAESLPAAPDDFPGWKDRVEAQSPGLKLLYLVGDPTDAPRLASEDPEDETLYGELAASEDFAQAIESVSYQEKFFSKNSYFVNGVSIRPVYVPLIDEEANVVGTIIFLRDEGAGRDSTDSCWPSPSCSRPPSSRRSG